MDFTLSPAAWEQKGKKDDWIDPELEFTRRKDKMESNFTLLVIAWEIRWTLSVQAGVIRNKTFIGTGVVGE